MTTTETATTWRLRGKGYEFCNCQPGCTCNFSGFPSSADGSCKAAVANHIVEGHCGDIDLSGIKAICLRHCRSPLGFFLAAGNRLRRPLGALRMGATHAAYCIGCCWALFAVLVALGTMHLPWMVALTALIVAEKHHPRGERLATAGALAFAALGTALLLEPATLVRIT